MATSEQTLTTFQTRVRQMILEFSRLKQENDELYAMLDKNEQEMAELRRRLEEKNRDYDSMKMAKILEVSDEDLEKTKTKLSKMIRDVNKCIAILQEQK